MTTIFDAIDKGDQPTALGLLRDDPALHGARHETGVAPVLYAMYAHQFALARAIAAAKTMHGGALDLAEAAAIDDADEVGALIAASGGAAAVDARTPDGFTPLQLAAYFGAPAAASALIAAGADIDAVSDNAMRIQPLHAAAAGRHGDVAMLLIDKGADVSGRQRHGWTPLHSAAHNGDGDLVEALIAAGADATTTNDDGLTPAEVAAEAGHPSIAARLGHRS